MNKINHTRNHTDKYNQSIINQLSMTVDFEQDDQLIMARINVIRYFYTFLPDQELFVHLASIFVYFYIY
jgi:hypothetical protein